MMTTGVAMLDLITVRHRLKDYVRGAIQYGNFTLHSGAESTRYFDLRRVTLGNYSAALVARLIIAELEHWPGGPPDAVGGMATGAIPMVASVVALDSRFSGFYVHKTQKEHGLRNKIENAPKPGTRVVVLEDVVTTGSSLLKAIDSCRWDAELDVVGAIALLDRGDNDVQERICSHMRCRYYTSLFMEGEFPNVPNVQ